MSWIIGVDVGGTFTDFFALSLADGGIRVYKRPSTPQNPAAAIVEGMQEMCAAFDIDPDLVSRICHGTTVATNALIQRRGGRVALLTTEGFRDLLEIGRQTRPHLFSLQQDNPRALVDRAWRYEVAERVGPRGEVRRPLSMPSLQEAISQIARSDAQSCAVAFLFAFLNPKHERDVREVLAKALPQIYISLSSDVQPEFREFERFSTTVLNAYLQPVMDAYITEVGAELGKVYRNAAVGIYQSSGGLMSVQRARALPVRTALSGPAAGVVGAVHVGRTASRPNIITFDMGGTSTDVCLIRDYTLPISHERDVAGFPIRLPMVDINTIGAGGGSVAWFDRDGLMKVGPISAGAVPGPACYGHGGDRPTVSDANCILGRLAPGGLIGGRMTMDIAAARQVFAPLAERLGMSIEHTALGVLGIVTANMVGAIRAVSVERGNDPRDFGLMPFGGAGPLHAAEVARSLGMEEIVVPPAPGILCALGLLVSDLKEDFVRTMRVVLDEQGLAEVRACVGELAADAGAWAVREGVDNDSRYDEVTLDMRFVGQNFELPVQVGHFQRGRDLRLPDRDALRALFFQAHDKAYGFHNADAQIEIVNVRLSAGCALSPVRIGSEVRSSDKPQIIGRQEVYFTETQALDTPIYDRATFTPGFTFQGPAIVSQFDSTTLVFPGDAVSVDDSLNLIVRVQQ
ncbi:MAG: hydantoinase/oxoprolinase family protein [Pseudorhodoplanes sp.]|uniref:hydantoinase/oxoprolinase family protein n=1 Tax=Pseudorhodoplanes sp. TaxID=1934341 RepID=UPI003D0C83FC